MSLKSWFDKLSVGKKIILVISLIIFYPIGIIFLISYLISAVINLNSNKSSIEKLQMYLDEKNELNDSRAKLILQKGEKVLYSEQSEFYEERAVRNYQGTGHSFRIMKGWYFRINSGQAESHGELRKIDSGILNVTNKRFIFDGTFKNYNYNQNKIIMIEPFSDAVRIAVEGRQKTLMFTTPNPFLLGAALQTFKDKQNLDSKSKEFIEKELKIKIVKKIKMLGENWRFNVLTYEEMSEAFKLLLSCITIDIEDYRSVLTKIPSSVLEVKSIVEDIFKLLLEYNKELQKIKLKLGDSVSKNELQTEFDNLIDKKYKKDMLIDKLNELLNSVKKLNVAEVSSKIDVKNK